MIRTNKITLRFWVVFFIHLIIKSFDLSFPRGPFTPDWRSLFFSLYLIGYGLIIWRLAEWFDKQLRKRFPHPESNHRRMLFFTLAHVLFAAPVMLSVNHFYRLGDSLLFSNAHLWTDISFFNPELTASLVSIYLIILGFSSYQRIQAELLAGKRRAEQLEMENIKAQYAALKAQIEPHFLFNSLSVLSSLVYSDADHSVQFIIKLSKMLRYVIEKNKFNLVSLREELDFVNAYYFLIKTRYTEGVLLETELDSAIIENTFIPPVALQLLIENAINHNTYGPDTPLTIRITNNKDYLVVSNNRNPRTELPDSTRAGLSNISKRYQLIARKKIKVNQSNEIFEVQLPILKQNYDEGSNY